MKIHEYKAILSPKLEEQAYQTVKSEIGKLWGDPKKLRHHKGINKVLFNALKKNKVQFQDIPIEHEARLLTLIKEIDKGLFIADPILSRLHIFVRIPPEDIDTRKLVLTHISDENLEPYHGLFLLELFKGQNLLKLHGEYLKSVPLRATVVGKMLDDLLWDFEHYRLVDLIKMMGAVEAVDSLRESRVYQNKGETIFDYSPLFKRSFGPKGVTIELLDDDLHRVMKDTDHKTRKEEDEALCDLIRNSQADPRENIYFGHNYSQTDHTLTILHGGESEKLPIQLLPRYYGYLKRKASEYSLTRLKETVPEENTELDNPQEHEKLDEIQEGMTGLLQGARNWERGVGPADHYLRNSIFWEIGHAFERVSTDKLKDVRAAWEEHDYPNFKSDGVPERILLEKMDSYRGGSLNETYLGEDPEEKEKIEDLIQGGQTPLEAASNEERKAMDRVIWDELRKKDPALFGELTALYNKNEMIGNLDQTERQRLSRLIKKARKIIA